MRPVIRSAVALLTLDVSVAMTVLPSAAENEDKPVCAVLPLDAGPGIHAGQAGLLANQYSVTLGRAGRYEILPRYEVNHALHSHGFSRGRFASSLKAAVAAGKALHADYVITGSIGKTETGYTLATSLVSINEARTANAARNNHSGSFDSFAAKATPENVKLLLGITEFPGKVAPAKPPAVEEPAAPPPAPKPDTRPTLVESRERPSVVPEPRKEPVAPPPPPPEERVAIATPADEAPDPPPDITAFDTAPKPPEITTTPPEIVAAAPPEIKPLPPLESELPDYSPVTVSPRPPTPPQRKPRPPDKPERKRKKSGTRDIMLVAMATEPELVQSEPPKPVPTMESSTPDAAPAEVAQAAAPAASEPEAGVTLREETSTPDGTFALMFDNLRNAAVEKLDIGMRFNHYIYQTEEDDYIGSIDTIESENQYIFEEPLLDSWWPNGLYLLWRFSETFATELTYTELRAITLSHGGRHTDGTVVVAGPILTCVRRFANDTTFTPYAGLGLAFFVSTHVTGDNPWHNGFGGRDWDGYNAWVASGSPEWPNGGYQRTFRVADELGYVVALGLEKEVREHWSLDLNARYTHVVFENTYTLSFYGNRRGKSKYSEWDLSNFNIGLGFKYSF